MLPLGSACASIVGLDETLSGYLAPEGDMRYSFGLKDVYKRQSMM